MSNGVSFAKHVGLVGSWNVLSILLSIIYFYVTANWLGPELYGLFVLSLGLISLPYTMIYSGIGQGVTKYTAETKSREVMKAGLKLQYVLSLAAFLIFFFSADFLALKYGKPIDTPIKILSLIYLVTPITETFKSTSWGLLNIKNIVKIEFVLKSSMILAVASFIYVGLGLKGAALGYSVSFLLVSLYALWLLKAQKMKDTEFELGRLIYYSKWSMVYNGFKVWMINIILVIGGLYLTSEEIGYYSFAYRIAMMTTGLVVVSIGNVAFPYFSEFLSKKDHDRVSDYLSVSLAINIFIGAVIFILALLVARPVTSLIFPRYLPGLWIVYLILAIFILFPVGLIGNVFKATAKMELATASVLTSTIFTAISALYFIPKLGLTGMVVSLLSSITVKVIMDYLLLRMNFPITLRRIKRSDLGTMKRIFSEVIGLKREA